MKFVRFLLLFALLQAAPFLRADTNVNPCPPDGSPPDDMCNAQWNSDTCQYEGDDAYYDACDNPVCEEPDLSGTQCCSGEVKDKMEDACGNVTCNEADLAKECCSDGLYDPGSQQCCDGDSVKPLMYDGCGQQTCDDNAGEETGCCSGNSYNESDYQCCEGELKGMMYDGCGELTCDDDAGGETGCCSGSSYNEADYQCCEGVLTELMYDGCGVETCDEDKNDNHFGCCAGVSYNEDENQCCDGVLTKLMYDGCYELTCDEDKNDNHFGCCDGVSYNGDEQECCDDGTLAGAGQVCCGETGSTTAVDEADCCGDSTILGAGEVCCTPAAGGESSAKSQEECCDANPVTAEGNSDLCINDPFNVGAAGGSGVYNYSTGNAGIATVDDCGEVTGKASGSTSIKVTDSNGCEILVDVAFVKHKYTCEQDSDFDDLAASGSHTMKVGESFTPNASEYVSGNYEKWMLGDLCPVGNNTNGDGTRDLGDLVTDPGPTFYTVPASITPTTPESVTIAVRAKIHRPQACVDANGGGGDIDKKIGEIQVTVTKPKFLDACGHEVDVEPKAGMKCCEKTDQPYDPATESCCEDFKGGDVGPVNISATVEASSTSGTTCSYEYTGTLSIDVPLAGISKSTKNLTIPGLKVTWDKEKDKPISNITVTRDADYIFDVATGIKGNLKHLSLSYATASASMSGDATIEFNVTDDTTLGRDEIVLKKGGTGTLALTYSTGTPTAAFSNLVLHVDMLKKAGGKVIATFDADSSAAGSDINGKFHASGLEVDDDRVKLTLDTFDCKGKLHLDPLGMDIESGKFKATMKLPDEKQGDNYVTGTMVANGDYTKDKGYTGTVTVDKNSALLFASGKLFGTLKAELDPAFTMKSLTGTGIKLTHKGVGTSEINLTSFYFTQLNGLETMSVKNAKVVYKGIIQMSITNADWNSNDSLLEFDKAHVEFGNDNVVLDAAGFQLDAISGLVDLKSFKGNADFPNKTRPNFHGEISGEMDGNNIKASIGAEFMSVGVIGKIEVGIEGVEPDSYNYGYVTLDSNLGSGIPMGQIPVKLKRLQGAAGYNESVSAGVWTKQKGSFVLGAGAGFCDSANLVQIDSYVQITLSDQNPKLDMTGNIAIPASGTPYVTGSVDAHYILGNDYIDGTAQTALSYPQGGSVIHVDSGSTTFKVGKSEMNIKGGGLTGKLLSRFNFTGGYNLSGNPSQSSTLNGQIGISVSDAVSTHVSGSAVGFSVVADLSYTAILHATLNLQNEKVSGSADISFTANADATVTWPSIFDAGQTHIQASANCNGSVNKYEDASSLMFSGDATFSYNGHTSPSISVTDVTIF